MTQRLLLAALLTLSGCTMTYTDPVLSSDNPANPAAIESPPPPRSNTLNLAAAEPVFASKKVPEHIGNEIGDMAMPPHAHPPTKVAPSVSTSAEPASTQMPVMYACPMHPEVTSDKPNQRCPKCGMKLRPVSEIKATQGESE